MIKYEWIRLILQCATLSAFIFQMQESVRKYLAHPVVHQQSTMNVQDIEVVIII